MKSEGTGLEKRKGRGEGEIYLSSYDMPFCEGWSIHLLLRHRPNGSHPTFNDTSLHVTDGFRECSGLSFFFWKLDPRSLAKKLKGSRLTWKLLTMSCNSIPTFGFVHPVQSSLSLKC